MPMTPINQTRYQVEPNAGRDNILSSWKVDENDNILSSMQEPDWQI